MDTTKKTILATHNNVAELLGVMGTWGVHVALDDVGIYINLTDPANPKHHRSLSLCDEDGSDDLEAYHWQFWNSKGAWFDSTLGVDADAEEILGFLRDCLHEEDLFTEEGRLMQASK